MVHLILELVFHGYDRKFYQVPCLGLYKEYGPQMNLVERTVVVTHGEVYKNHGNDLHS